MIRYILLFFAFITTICTCCDRFRESNVITLYPQLKKTEAVLIIPGAGCEGCIGAATQFAKVYADSLNIGVVFTRVVSYKNLRFSLGSDFFSSPRIQIDSSNAVQLNEEYYPTIYFPKTDEILISSPENPDALKSLKKYKFD